MCVEITKMFGNTNISRTRRSGRVDKIVLDNTDAKEVANAFSYLASKATKAIVILKCYKIRSTNSKKYFSISSEATGNMIFIPREELGSVITQLS